MEVASARDLEAAPVAAIVVGLITLVQVVTFWRFLRGMERNDLKEALEHEQGLLGP